MKKTKIVCTLGPACESDKVIEEMMLAGMDVARVNFSHGTHEQHKITIDRFKALREKLGTHTPLLLDTKGPEIRTKSFINPPVTLEAGQTFTLCMYDTEGDESKVSVTHTGLYKDINVGSRILIDDGLIEMRVEDKNSREIICRVINGGKVSNNKSVNVPGVHLSLDFLSDRDKSDIEFGIKEDFDFIAASFTQCADDILKIRHFLEAHNCHDILIIAKIENGAGVENIDEILGVADGIMVARGDLGVEIPLEEIPVIQKSIISKAYTAGKPVITATQMLESMTYNPRPTRAEITDVANAIYDGSSAIMTSGETAIGKHPVEVVRTMVKIAERTESDIDYSSRFSRFAPHGFLGVTTAVSHAACTTSLDLDAKAIIAVSKSGKTLRMISRFRPKTMIIGCTPVEKTCRQLMLSWGVTPLVMEERESTDDLFDHAIARSIEQGLVSLGDLAVLTAGTPLGISGTTNMIKVAIIGDTLATGMGIGDGIVCGELCVCPSDDDALKNYKSGTILVIPFTTNKIIDVIRNAAGIICEQGGADSHAAIIGRALNIPVIVGAAGATKILKSKTAVTIDCKKGIVFNGDIYK
ncbi:MAG: pyruvate kinase [Ruminococcaceae bacterium]|nr:pyruvate kinase [Oscillospiraceae bacterium]